MEYIAQYQWKYLEKIHNVERSEDYDHKQHGVYSTVPMEISRENT